MAKAHIEVALRSDPDNAKLNGGIKQLDEAMHQADIGKKSKAVAAVNTADKRLREYHPNGVAER